MEIIKIIRGFHGSCNSVILQYSVSCILRVSASNLPDRKTMDYLRMDGKQYASKVRNEALNDFDWLSQWLE